MQSSTLLRRFGWRSVRGKWVASGHSRPLTLEQAKKAFARDLKSKDFNDLKRSGKLDRAQAAVNAGYQYDRGKFKRPKGRKKLDLDDISAIQAKEELTAKNKSAKDLGFTSDKQRKTVADWIKLDLPLYFRFVNRYDETQGRSTIEVRAEIARLLYRFKTGITKAIRQQALNDLLIVVGYRTGNEPYPAGQTPPKK